MEVQKVLLERKESHGDTKVRAAINDYGEGVIRYQAAIYADCRVTTYHRRCMGHGSTQAEAVRDLLGNIPASDPELLGLAVEMFDAQELAP